MARQRNVVAHVQGNSARVREGCPVDPRAIPQQRPASRAMFRRPRAGRVSHPSRPPEGLAGRVRQESFPCGCGGLSFATTFAFVHKAVLKLAMGWISDLSPLALLKSFR